MPGIKESISTDEIIKKISKYVELAIKGNHGNMM